MLQEYQENGDFSIDNVSELIQIISTLNYSGKQILIDCESESCNQVLKIKINEQNYNVLLVSPPNFDQESIGKKMILTSLVFPFGLDMQSDMEMTKALAQNKLILDIIPGITGIGDSFSFKLNTDYLNFKQEGFELSKTGTEGKGLNLDLYSLSPFQSSNYMLGVVCEVIFLFKKSHYNLNALMNALKIVFFKRLPKSENFKSFSFKILSLLALNDRLLISAGAHFIINNIYAEI